MDPQSMITFLYYYTIDEESHKARQVLLPQPDEATIRHIHQKRKLHIYPM
jgi:hypothetical protein